MIVPPPPPPDDAPKRTPSSRPQPGVNSRLASTPFGFVISGSPSGGSSFAHPWRPALVGKDGVRLAKGVVIGDVAEGYEPTITEGGRATPISGDPAKRLGPPTLRLDRAVATKALESWVCLEVTPTKEGKLADATGARADGVTIEVVHRNAPTLFGQATGRHPLALIVWSTSGPARIYPVTFFNLRYHRTTPAPGKGSAQHLFY
jgi:hypothetical protein